MQGMDAYKKNVVDYLMGEEREEFASNFFRFNQLYRSHLWFGGALRS